MFYLTTCSTYFISSDMALNIQLRTTQIMMAKTICHLIRGYSFRVTTRDILFAPSRRHGSTYHSLFYTSRGALAGICAADFMSRCEICCKSVIVDYILMVL